MNLRNLYFPIYLSKKIFSLIIFFCFFYSILAAYEVSFEGVEDPQLLKLFRTSSQLEKLKTTPPTTRMGLKRRAENDNTAFIQVLQSQAYYNAKVDFHLKDDHVFFMVDTGPIYPFAEFNIHYFQNEKEVSSDILCKPITLSQLKVKLGSPAIPETILSAEDTLLDYLNLQGYAFAAILKRQVYADQKTKKIIVSIEVDIGNLTYFGSTQVKGLERIHKNFIYKKLRWNLGEIYNPQKIEKTQEALELSGLFRTVNISHGEELVDEYSLPISISVLEAKQKTIGFGLNYTTALGPGFTGEWEDRNFRGNGQKLTTHADVWEKLQTGSISYSIPDFKRQDQILIWLLNYEHEKTKSFTERSLSFSGLIERKINRYLRVSYGLAYKLLRSQRSDHNGTFDLIKIPLQLQWNNADSILEPTKGGFIQLKVIPSFQILAPQFIYSINTFTGGIYHALDSDKKYILAGKLSLGSIVGASEYDIPPPERFYAGSENTLRGYRYMTVSPLGRRNKPIGGRSLFIYSLELRTHVQKNFGWVLFYDIGNVYKELIPNFKKKMLQTLGLGIRYYTPIGPLRLDIAVPLDRRKGNKKKHHNHYIDHTAEFYFSIGQSF
jgi:translocation and assembly module TamA